jgi:hypothetical protein
MAKYTVESVTERSVLVWDGVSFMDKSREHHTSEYFVGVDHGFEPGDEVQIGLTLKNRPIKEQEQE